MASSDGMTPAEILLVLHDPYHPDHDEVLKGALDVIEERHPGITHAYLARRGFFGEKGMRQGHADVANA